MKIFKIAVQIFIITAVNMASPFNGRFFHAEIAVNAEENKPQGELSLFNLVGYTETGAKKWEIFGKTATMASGTVFLNGILAKAYGEEDETVLHAKQGEYDEQNRTVHLENDVVITTSDGAELKTDELDWDADKDLMTTEAHVRIEKNDMIAHSEGARAQSKLKRAKLLRQVQVDVNKATEIICDGPLEVDYEKNIAIFHENVVIKDKEGEIYADLVTAHFDRESQTISEVEAEGDVVIVRGENRSFSERLLYDHRTGKVTLLGKPKLFIAPDQDTKSEFITNK